MKIGVLLHPQSRKRLQKFFESNEPIKSSLKGKEPKIPMRLETGESARQTEKNIKYNNIQ